MQLWSHEATKDALKQDAPHHNDDAQALREVLGSKSKAGDEPHTPLPSPPTPVALCGKTEQIGRGVIAVTHFVTSPTSGAVILPALLASRPPPPHPETSTIGSGNYAAAPRAVILGGAFDDAATAVLREAVAGARAQSADVRKVPWLRQDSSKPAPPLGPEYGKAMVVRVKEALARLQGEGKLDGSYEGDEWY
ncbi:hypothetical protein ColTof4_08664 [Colletotrichum tofieldiae]|uniref:Uncharacterized protein n=1 Tax=Colletotrichum tofieldiae TaxID=708197 RepID=A0A166MCW8_9PEZI|nr:hypothetical protein CT0861_01494 [Colletotrichum tofieldiae]GKT56796.1 hypothetical protein ColTof3_04135 [Colletotrichum tofieldiae]GKT76241.1 hypothetical protein ColTof4_08664 [Colletotrichum tofieldiae]